MKKLLFLAVLTLVIMSCEQDDANETPTDFDIEDKWLCVKPKYPNNYK